MNILEEIIVHKRRDLESHKEELSFSDLYQQTERYINEGIHLPLSMSGSLQSSRSGIIAEFKRRSPSKGWIKENGKPNEVPLSYSENGASAISILTNSEYFGGSTDYISIARERVKSTPILRKEFIIDEYQVYESRLIGSDAILLIASALTINECNQLAKKAHELGLETLLEIHGEEELDYVNEHIDMVGVNNRDLTTFKTDISQSFRLSMILPKEYVLVSESGISNPKSVKELRNVGFKGFLIGETFMSSADPGESLKQFIHEVES